MTRDQELWAVALWVEKRHGTDGPRFIAEQIGRLALVGDGVGVSIWREVAARFEALNAPQMADGAS